MRSFEAECLALVSRMSHQQGSPTTYTDVRHIPSRRRATDTKYEPFDYPEDWDRQDEIASVALAIRDHRQARDMTRTELARLLGCTEATVRRYEDGEQLPSPARAEKIREVLGFGAEEFHRGLPGF